MQIRDDVKLGALDSGNVKRQNPMALEDLEPDVRWPQPQDEQIAVTGSMCCLGWYLPERNLRGLASPSEWQRG